MGDERARGQQTPPPADPFDILTGGPSLHLAYKNLTQLAFPEECKTIPNALADMLRRLGNCAVKKDVVVAGPSRAVMVVVMWWAIVFCDGVREWFNADPACLPLRPVRDLSERLQLDIVSGAPGHMKLDAYAMRMVTEVEILRPGFPQN
jgi:hypothetical protein